jgi:hypothetical protein
MVPESRGRHRVCILCNAGAAMDPSILSNVGGLEADNRPGARPVLSVPRHPEIQNVACNWADTITTPHLRVPILLRSHRIPLHYLESHSHRRHRCCRAHWSVVLGTDYPSHRRRCLPYFTPMSDLFWYIQHTTASATVSGCHWALEWFRNRSGPNLGARPGRLSNWSEFLKNIIDRNKGHLKDGLRGNIFRHAKTAPVDVDLKTLTWLLQRPIMGEKSKLQGFIESIPPQILLQLSSLDAESGKKTIRDHLFNLFQGCLGNKDKLEPKERSQRLEICLDAFYQIVKPSSLPDKGIEMILQYVWSNFKDLDLVRKLWDDSDPAIRIFSHSICAHLSRNILRKSKPDKLEQSWLREFVGKKPEDAIFDPQLPDHLSTWDHYILESFVYGVFPCLKDGVLVKPEHASCFVETLAVLMNAGNSGKLSKEIFSEEIFSFIEWAKEDDHKHHDEVADHLDQLFCKYFTDPTTNTDDRAE